MTIAEMAASCRWPDREAERASRARWDSIAKPLHGLGLLEDAVVRICAVTGDPDCPLRPRGVAVFCADNGVVAQGVTQTGQEVTAIVAENMTRGETSVCKMAAQAGAGMLASHCSGEPGARRVLDALGLAPVMTAGFCLGEGTGAVALLPLLDMAAAVYREMSTFGEIAVEAYRPLV